MAGSYIIVLAIILLLVRFVAAEYFETPINHSRVAGRRLPEVTTSVYQTYDDHIDLAGYTIPSGVIQADAEIQFDLLWRARGNPQKEYHTTILVMGPDGQAWSPAGTLRPIGYETPPPTTMWETGNYVYDPHIVSLLPGTPPGIYHLDVVIFDKQTLRPLSLVNSDGSLGQPSYRLGSIEVTRPDVPFSLKSLGVGEETEAQTCDSYRLWSMTLDRADAAPGDIVAVRWVWEMLQTGGDDSDAVLTLVDSDNRIVESWHLPLSGVWWPVQNWNTAERWVGRHVIRLPNQIEGGHYRVNVSLGGCDTSLASVALNIADIVREWEIPGHFTKVKTSFSSQITLVGYDLPQEDFSPGDTVTLGLSWQAVKEVGKSYRVFLHLVDSEGRVVDQDDGEPANWKRPTTGWLQDEVVTEARELTIPETTSAEDYTINVGLYTQDGTRLLLPSGEDTYTLTRIQVGNE